MFGDNLKKYRTEKGLSQNDIAEKLFVTRQCVSKWENGTTEPDLQSLQSLSGLLGVSIDELVKDNGEEQEKKPQNGNAVMLIANILTAAFCTLAFIVLWRFLPQEIPAHWSTSGNIDRYGSRNEVLIMIAATIALLGVDAAVFFAYKKQGFKKSMYITHGIMIFFQIAFLVFMWAMYAKYLMDILSMTTCLSAALILCVSAAMHPKINKQNHFIGVRIKETLNSVTVWNKTNALACYMLTAASTVIFTVNMILTFPYCYLCLIAYVVAGTAAIVYAKSISKRAD